MSQADSRDRRRHRSSGRHHDRRNSGHQRRYREERNLDGLSPEHSPKAPQDDHGPKKDRHHHHSKEEQSLTLRNQPGTVFGNQKEIDDYDQLLIEDRKGDPSNLIYGAPYRYNVPRYQTAGHRRLIGLRGAFRVTQMVDGNSIIVDNEDLDPGIRTKAKLPPIAPEGKKVLSSRPKGFETSQIDLQRDYIPLTDGLGRKRRRLEFASLQGREEELSEEDSDLDETSKPNSDTEHNEAFEAFRYTAAQQRSIELSRAVHDRPQDIDAWRALISHRDSMHLTDTTDGRQNLTNAENRGLIDIKISMYEDALSKNRDNPQRERLIIGLMEEGTRIWDTSKLASQWKMMLKENLDNLNLWVKFLDFQQSRFMTFSYEECRAAFTGCLQLVLSQPEGDTRDKIYVYVLLRLTIFMKESGFQEYAVGIWQACLEYNFFRPTSLPPNSTIQSFQNFWDSEAARIGEPGATGWSNSTNRSLEPKSGRPDLTVNRDDIFGSWTRREQEHTAKASLPARTLDEVAEDDPYRVIIFSDIEPYLVDAQTVIMRELLLTAFLRFCNMPPLPKTAQGVSGTWWSDPFTMEFPFGTEGSLNHSDTSEELFETLPAGTFPTDSMSMLCDGNYWFNCWSRSAVPEAEGLDPMWQLNALHQLVSISPAGHPLTAYVLAFELMHDVRETRRYARALLKQHPADVRLYNVLAVAECRLGNFDAAERVWSTVMSMSQDFKEPDRLEGVLLWRTWIWELLDRGQQEKALLVLLHVSSGLIRLEDVSNERIASASDNQGILHLKARRFLGIHLSEALSLRQGEYICHYSDLLAILTYLTNDHKLSSSLQCYPPHEDKTTLELIHQSRARLVHYHALTSPTGYRPRDIAATLAESLRLFPDNTIFLTLHHKYTRHAPLTDRIRRLHCTVPTSSPSLSQLIFSISTTLRLPIILGSTSNSIRAAFERAVERGAIGEHCPGIWTRFVRWEVSIAPLEMRARAPKTKNISSTTPMAARSLARAIDVFYHAVQACPWAKPIYMLAFAEERLREAIGFNGLRRIYDTMIEKGLRVHVDLEGVLEEYDRKAEREKGDVPEWGGEETKRLWRDVDSGYGLRVD